MPNDVYIYYHINEQKKVEPLNHPIVVHNTTNDNSQDLGIGIWFLYIMFHIMFFLCLIECFKNCYIRFNHSNININNLFTRRIISPEDNIYYHHKIFIKDNFENDICSICLDEFINDEDIENKDEIIGLKCNHMFHKKCVEPWIITKKSCPLCKVEV